MQKQRWAGWVFFGLYILFAGIGRWLQFLSNATSSGSGAPTFESYLQDGLFIFWVFGGILLISRLPANPVGWLFPINAVLFAADQFAFGYAYFDHLSPADPLPGARLAAFWWSWSGRALAAYGIGLLFLFFPTGRPFSNPWRKVFWINTGVVVAYVISSAISPIPILTEDFPFSTNFLGFSERFVSAFLPVTWIFYFGMILGTFVAIFSLVYRFIKSKGVERQQIKWFAYAASLFIPGITFLILGFTTNLPFTPFVQAAGVILIQALFLGLPAASTIAILRYRLWDIDVIINRTLVYGGLTATLVVIYSVTVILLQSLTRNLTGQGDQLAVVLSTLTIAGLFNPLRRRIQNDIDNLFYRRKYDAEKILAEFATPLRNEVDLDRLSEAIIMVVEETIQPDRVSLWLKSM